MDRLVKPRGRRVTWDPEGIVVGEAFQDYVEQLRDTWSGDDELMKNHGMPAEKRLFATNS